MAEGDLQGQSSAERFSSNGWTHQRLCAPRRCLHHAVMQALSKFCGILLGVMLA